MADKVAIIIDGWFMRKRIYKTKKFEYSAKNIHNYCKSLLRKDQVLFRIYYYDTEPLRDKGHHPATKKSIDFGKTWVAQEQDRVLREIREYPNFALRLGVTYWKGGSWSLSQVALEQLLNGKLSPQNIKERDILPRITQKGVDMRIGMDIAALAYKRLVDKIIVITGDQDIVPALKLARKEGIIVGVDSLKNPASLLLREHTDFFHTELECQDDKTKRKRKKSQ